MRLTLTLEAMRAALASKPEFRFTTTENGHTIVCYMISGSETFNTPLAREGRGIVFGPDGAVSGRPLHKFMNVGECPQTMPHVLPWEKATRVMAKVDGSLIHTVRLGEGSWAFKSKKSFESDVALAATAWAKDKPALQDWLTQQTAEHRTCIFEWVSPEHRIVVGYPEDGLWLLHIRENHTGRYLAREELEALYPPVPLVAEDDEAWAALRAGTLLDLRQAKEGIEGWVIQFDNADMVKLKTEWYLTRHRAITFVRERDIAGMVLDEAIDDLKTIWTQDGLDMTRIMTIEANVLHDIERTIEEVKAEVDRGLGLGRKDFALANKDHPLFSLIMAEYSGKEVDYKEWYRKHRLPNWPLTQVRARGAA